MPLNSRARQILARQARGDSPFVFPSPRDPSRPRGGDLPLWNRIRKEAGIEDVRLHDLRHTHASHAVMNGVPVPVVSRLLGHSNTRMTLSYAHLGDRDIEQAAERVGRAIGDPRSVPGFGSKAGEAAKPRSSRSSLPCAISVRPERSSDKFPPRACALSA